VLTLFDVAKLLDAGRVDEALAALAARDSSEPDHVLMEARVRARAGHGEQARQLVQRLSQAPLLEPEVRAGVARLALELGETELAYAQAKRAHADDAEQPMVSLSLAWAAIRWTRRTADPESFRLAKRALMPLATRGGPNESLLLALRACVEGHGGRAELAEQLARKALDIEPTADGFAALAMAAAGLGKVEEVKQASARLRELDAAEADALAKSLASNGDRLFCLDETAPTAGTEQPGATDIWGPLELKLLSEDPADAWSRFAQLATDTLAQVTGAARREGPALATVAASFLTVAPVSRDFAPFDETPWSLHRVAALLSLLSTAAKGTTEDSNSPVMKLLGAYVGEVLRQSLGLRWHGSLTDGTARLEGNGARHAPFDIVRDHLVGNTPIPVERLLEQTGARASSVEPRPPAVEPPCPWDPAKWPAPERLPSYANALRHSVISQHCARVSARLDGTPESVLALDAYLSLLAPDGATPVVDTGWARRASVLAGAYAGQVLCDARDAEWLTDDSTELGPQSYGVQIAPGRIARPVLQAFERLTARGPSLSEWLELWL